MKFILKKPTRWGNLVQKLVAYNVGSK
jgi:hypothetical protein